MKSAAELIDPAVRRRYVEQALHAYRAAKAEPNLAERPGQNDGLHGEGEEEDTNLDAWFDNAIWK